jgi:hypothetical protein
MCLSIFILRQPPGVEEKVAEKGLEPKLIRPQELFSQSQRTEQ